MPGISNKHNTDAVKKKIADAVLRVFEKRQPQKLTVEMVARESGMSKGALYKYFKDKDDLIIYAMLHALEPYAQKNLAIAEGKMPFVEKLQASAEISLEGTERVRHFLFFLFHSASAYSTEVIKAANERRFENFRRIDRMMLEGLRQEEASEDKVRGLRIFFAGLIRAAYFLRIALPEELRRPFAKDAEEVVRHFLYGVGRRISNDENR